MIQYVPIYHGAIRGNRYTDSSILTLAMALPPNVSASDCFTAQTVPGSLGDVDPDVGGVAVGVASESTCAFLMVLYATSEQPLDIAINVLLRE